MGSTVGTCFISGKEVETGKGVDVGIGVEAIKGVEVGANSVVEISFSEQDMIIKNEIKINKNLYNPKSVNTSEGKKRAFWILIIIILLILDIYLGNSSFLQH
jgi:hypothetical protein